MRFILFITVLFLVSCEDKTSKHSPTIVHGNAQVFGRLIGVWLDEELSMKMQEKIGYKFVEKNGDLYWVYCNPELEVLSDDANSSLPDMASKLIVDGARYTNAQNPAEYFVIDPKDQDLLVYDSDGLVVKCKKIFFK